MTTEKKYLKFILLLAICFVTVQVHGQTARTMQATSSASLNVQEVETKKAPESVSELKNFVPSSPIAALNDLRLQLLQLRVELDYAKAEEKVNESVIGKLNLSIAETESKINKLLPAEKNLLDQKTNGKASGPATIQSKTDENNLKLNQTK